MSAPIPPFDRLANEQQEKDRYHHGVVIEGDSTWQQVLLSPSDFKKRTGETPEDWDGLDIVLSLPAGWDWQDLKMRNLTWIKNGNQGDSVR